MLYRHLTSFATATQHHLMLAPPSTFTIVIAQHLPPPLPLNIIHYCHYHVPNTLDQCYHYLTHIVVATI
ncbi:hypothetical protein SESBI_43175 [Sesbania bispinosa]|nr:hypothetical protein SESBI_43175 [Sesbania bispinosa]